MQGDGDALVEHLQGEREARGEEEEEDEEVHLDRAHECGCGRGHPCYWSSEEGSEESILFRLSAQACLITGLAVLRYRAWQQPEDAL
ncbi:hypothetical protein T484DRAFT_1843014 [Baffinella frigidus]|nr:hypothetical protein T484DRAFT_1843014 [Cryptophyta sp. CCMP2293]